MTINFFEAWFPKNGHDLPMMTSLRNFTHFTPSKHNGIVYDKR